MSEKDDHTSQEHPRQGTCAGCGRPFAPEPRKTLLYQLGCRGWLGTPQAEQFVLGALLGGGAAYMLGDEERRERVMQSAVRLYTSVLGSVEEFKEQLADIQAEVNAELAGQAPLQ